jgi:serine/threonine protein kinase
MGLEEVITPGLIQDKYIIGEVIGKGGFSTVRSGYDRETRQKVAIKYIPKGTRP